MSAADEAVRALEAWRASDAAGRWAPSVDTILMTRWHGDEIAWPVFDGESYEIIRLADSTVLDDEELTPEDAQRLTWRALKIDPTAVLE